MQEENVQLYRVFVPFFADAKLNSQTKNVIIWRFPFYCLLQLIPTFPCHRNNLLTYHKLYDKPYKKGSHGYCYFIFSSSLINS